MKYLYQKCDLKLFEEPVTGLEPCVPITVYVVHIQSFWLSLLWKESKSTHQTPVQRWHQCAEWGPLACSGHLNQHECRCSLRIPNAFRVLLRTQSLVLWKVLDWKKSTSAKWSWKSRYSLGNKPKILALFLNLTGNLLKICTECYCRDVT